MADQLPKYIVVGVSEDEKLISNAARYTYESDRGAGFISCSSGGSVFDPLAKIEVEIAKINTKFVHLKFSHTNKYWGRRGSGPNNYWIHATSNQPDEDISKESCTLFEPSIHGPGLLNLTHIQSGVALHLDLSSSGTIYATPARTGTTTFGYIDCDTLLRLPTRILFKGNNGKYLKAYEHFRKPQLQFGADHRNDRFAPQEVELYPTGHVRIKSVYFGRFWRCEEDLWIYADANNDSSSNVHTHFWPVRYSAGVICLRTARNNMFCKRLTGSARTNCLSATTGTTEDLARLRIEEPTLKRNIFNVSYRMMDTRVYDERPVVAGTGSATNNSDTESSMTILIGYDKKRSSSFSRGYSMMTEVPTEIKAGIPFIAEGKIQVSADQITAELQWETTTEETTKAEASYTVVVPPRSRIVVDFIATSGNCSVPFSYTQEDRSSIDDQLYTSQHIDGIYTGLNYYDFRFEQREVLPLEATQIP